MFTKMAIFVFASIGIFALLFAALPSDYMAVSFESTLGAEKRVADYYDLQNVTLYANAGQDNMTYPYSSLNDHPGAPQFSAGLPTGQYLEVWWSFYPFGSHFLEFRHVEQWFFGWRVIARLNFQTENKTSVPYQRINAQICDDNYNPERNASLFYASGSALTLSCFFMYNQSLYADIGTAWNNGDIDYMLSYDVDWNATSVSALTILGQLLTFQAPALGITGVGGALISGTIAFPFWICTAILIIKLVQSVIPFIKGVEE